MKDDKSVAHGVEFLSFAVCVFFAVLYTRRAIIWRETGFIRKYSSGDFTSSRYIIEFISDLSLFSVYNLYTKGFYFHLYVYIT